MNAAQREPRPVLTDLPRAVLSLAAGIARSVERAVVGDFRVRTSRRNAWEAVCADRARAHQRNEIRRLVAGLTAAPIDARRGDRVS